MLIDSLVRELRDRGISVDNLNPIVTLPLRSKYYKFSKSYKKKYSKPLAKI